MHTLVIRPAAASDAAAIARIYNHYVLHTAITFEEQAVSDGEMHARMDDIRHAGLPWLVAEQAGQVLGYAYATKWRARSAYRHSVESSVYLAADATGKGLGARLYAVLLDLLREKGMHAVMAGITSPNASSASLHEKMGFRKVAHFAEVGFKFDRWIDVGYWQLLL